MPLTFQILSWHRTYKGKTKQPTTTTTKIISTTSKQNHRFILYCVKQEADPKLCDNAHQPARTLQVVSAAIEKYCTMQFQHFISRVKLPASLQMQGEEVVRGCYW